MDTQAFHTRSSGPELLLSTGCLFHLPLPVIASVGARAGFSGLDLVMGSPRIAPGPEVDAAHEILPVRVVHAPFRNWSAWGGHLGAWKAASALAGHVARGKPAHVTLHPPGSASGGLRDAMQTRWFSRAVDLPRLLDAPDNISFSLENLPWANAGGLFARDALSALVSECQEKKLGLTLDCCHLGISGRDIVAALERLPAPLISHVHFSDADRHTEHLPPGQGLLPVGPFLRGLGRTGYAGTLALELDPAHLPDIDPLDIADGRDEPLIRALAAMREGMRAALDGCPPPAWTGEPGGARQGHVAAAAF